MMAIGVLDRGEADNSRLVIGDPIEDFLYRKRIREVSIALVASSRMKFEGLLG